MLEKRIGVLAASELEGILSKEGREYLLLNYDGGYGNNKNSRKNKIWIEGCLQLSLREINDLIEVGLISISNDDLQIYPGDSCPAMELVFKQ